MLSIILVSVGTIRNDNLSKLALDYQQRLAPYAQIKIETVKAESFQADQTSRLKAQTQDEGRLQKVLQRYADRKIYLLSEHGTLSDTPQFSNLISKEPVVLVLAGALGWSPEFAAQYPQLSLSPLTMTHELAQVVLWEQLYRAATILQGKTYHY